MKLTIDTDKIVAKTVEHGVKGYDKARSLAPTAKKKAISFRDRMKKAVKAGKEAARS